jgi:UDP-N-acetylmuramyl-tripeptide synthetase
MTLGDLLKDVIEVPEASAELPIAGVCEDSRRVRPGDLFVAISGLTVDGCDFAPAAVKGGAAAVVAPRALELGVPCLVSKQPARVLALAAARLQGEPARALRLVGVTGTNGKTTTTYLCEAILAAAGRRPGVIGTVGYRYAGRSEPAPFTTPTALVLQELLARMRDARCTDVVAEVSSHALELGRVFGLDFEVAGFTHLTQDHLDLHGSMERYLRAKLLLFSQHLRAGGTAVVNVDGDGADEVLQVVERRGDVAPLRCSTRGRAAEAFLAEVAHSVDGIAATLTIRGEQVALRSRLLGSYNADNILMAAALCRAAGAPLAAIAEGIASLRGVPGRLERVEDPRGELAVLVDYAHTPDALERAMGVLRPLCRGRLLVVFGCGGDRDRSKRPKMGRAVARDADLGIVTSDNPRSEDPLSIIAMIEEGVREERIARLASLAGADRGYLVEPDRRRAIGLAVQAARPGDILLIAGKGHEDYQILRAPEGHTYKIHFDDREVAREAMEQR